MIKLPEWIDPEIWRAFEEMRKKVRKPLTDYARKLAISKLEQIYREHGHHPSDVLEQSILNGWQGLWPVSQTRENRKDEEVRKESRVGAGPVVHH